MVPDLHRGHLRYLSRLPQALSPGCSVLCFHHYWNYSQKSFDAGYVILAVTGGQESIVPDPGIGAGKYMELRNLLMNSSAERSYPFLCFRLSGHGR